MGGNCFCIWCLPSSWEVGYLYTAEQVRAALCCYIPLVPCRLRSNFATAKFGKAFFNAHSIFFQWCYFTHAVVIRHDGCALQSWLLAQSHPLPACFRCSSLPKRCLRLASCNKVISSISPSHSSCSSGHKKGVAKAVWSKMLPVWCFSWSALESHKIFRALFSHVQQAVTCTENGDFPKMVQKCTFKVCGGVFLIFSSTCSYFVPRCYFFEMLVAIH